MHAWKTCQLSSNELIFNASGELVHLTARTTLPMHSFQYMRPQMEQVQYYMEYSAGRKNGEKKRYLYSSHRYIKAMGSWEMLIIWYCWLIRCHCTRIQHQAMPIHHLYPRRSGSPLHISAPLPLLNRHRDAGYGWVKVAEYMRQVHC